MKRLGMPTLTVGQSFRLVKLFNAKQPWKTLPVFENLNFFVLGTQNPGYMKENFYIVIETMHYADRGVSENVSVETETVLLHCLFSWFDRFLFYNARFMNCHQKSWRCVKWLRSILPTILSSRVITSHLKILPNSNLLRQAGVLWSGIGMIRFV